MRDIAEEKQALSISGWLALPLWFALLLWAAWPFIGLVAWNALGIALPFPTQPSLLNVLAIPLLIFLGKGFGILQPNIAAIFTFFGRYAGTLRKDGFYWVNPFFLRQKMSLRANNLNTPTLKVNDRAGNPVEVAAVVVWRVADTARAAFDVEDYGTYIVIQSESAVRSVVSARWYDGDAHGRNSLRADMDAVAELLAGTDPGTRRAGRDSRLSKRASRTSPTRQRSPAPCCAGSRPKQWSPPAPASSMAQWAWSSWASSSWRRKAWSSCPPKTASSW
jgi:hypothetical protein